MPSCNASTPEPLPAGLAAALARFDDYLRLERNLSPHTRSGYGRDLRAFAAYLTTQALTQWPAVNEAGVRAYVSLRRRQGLEARSVQRLLSSLRAFFRFLMREGELRANPAEGVMAPKSRRALPKALDVDQMQQLLAAAADDPLSLRDLAMMELMYSSGLRLAELVSLDLSHLNLDDGQLRVLGKGGKERVLPIGRVALAVLQQWLAQRQQLAGQEERALFVSRLGRRISHRSVQQRMARHGLKNGLDSHVHPHRLRHSFASHLLESSGDVRAVQELLGHADIGTTQIYTHLDFQHLAAVYDQAHPRARKKR